MEFFDSLSLTVSRGPAAEERNSTSRSGKGRSKACAKLRRLPGFTRERDARRALRHLSGRLDAPQHRARGGQAARGGRLDRKSTRLNSSHLGISYAVFCLKKKRIVIS